MTNDHISAYKAVSHLVRKTKQVVMLYDGAIRYVQQAKAAIEKGDIESRFNSLTKACDIINGLQMSLDFNNGGQVAKLLYDYYAAMDMRLLSVHQSNDLSLLDLTIKHLKMMREAWEEIDATSALNESKGAEVFEIDFSNPAIAKPLSDAASISVTA